MKNTRADFNEAAGIIIVGTAKTRDSDGSCAIKLS
jgi:hypothetical protein